MRALAERLHVCRRSLSGIANAGQRVRWHPLLPLSTGVLALPSSPESLLQAEQRLVPTAARARGDIVKQLRQIFRGHAELNRELSHVVLRRQRTTPRPWRRRF